MGYEAGRARHSPTPAIPCKVAHTMHPLPPYMAKQVHCKAPTHTDNTAKQTPRLSHIYSQTQHSGDRGGRGVRGLKAKAGMSIIAATNYHTFKELAIT